MIISLRPIKLLLPLLLGYCLEQAFWEFYTDSADDPLLNYYQLAMLGLGLGAAVWYWRRMEPVVGRGMLLTVGYLLALMLESYATHGTWMVYLHVFSKILVLFLMYGAYGFFYQRGLPPLKPLVGVLFGVLILNLLFIHPEALSLKAFLDNDRGFSASSALVLVLPTLLCLNWYLERGKLLALTFFFVGMALVVFLQHRSVWLTTLAALAVNVPLVFRRVASARFSPQRVTMLVVLPLAVALVGGLATVLNNPDIIKKFETSYEDIANSDTQGTGGWRFKQKESYRSFVAERPLLGWRLEGFEVPMQFYDPTSNHPMWPDRTGHHFHSFYLDRLFYFGWLGLLLTVVLPCVQVVRRLAHPAPLTAEAAALIGLLAGSLVFGLSYDWPGFLYPLLGLMLATTARPAPAPALHATPSHQARAIETIFAT